MNEPNYLYWLRFQIQAFNRPAQSAVIIRPGDSVTLSDGLGELAVAQFEMDDDGVPRMLIKILRDDTPQ
jgi:hypothetical protein